MVRALRPLRSVRSKQKLVVEKRHKVPFLSKQGKDQCIENHLDWETAVVRQKVEDAETAIKQELEDMRNAEEAGVTTRKHQTTYEETLNAIGDYLSDLASSDNGNEWEFEDEYEEDPELGKQSDNDEPGWVMGTLSKTVQYCVESFLQNEMKLDNWTPLGWGDVINFFRERHMKYETTKLTVPAVVQPQMKVDAAASALTTYGELTENHDSVPGKSQMLQVTSRK